MIQTRKLGYWETTCRFAHDLVHGTGTVVAIAKVAGLIEFSTLRKAIFQLFERHPLLKTTLKTKHDGAYFYTDANFDSVPITYLQQQVEDEWQQIVEKELKATFQNDSVLWRITILSSIGAKEHHFIISAPV